MARWHGPVLLLTFLPPAASAQVLRPGKFQIRYAKPHVFEVRWAKRYVAPARTDLGRILQQERAPLELLKIAQVESGFDPLALSPKGARGIWQLMPDTARRFGLRVDASHDDRTDPVRSTQAAARYWKTLEERFSDWKLTLAAYNAGEGRVLDAIVSGGTRNFDGLVRQGLLPEETRLYVAKVLAQDGLLTVRCSAGNPVARRRSGAKQ
jgi:membrane-bound lytic murein transglycosylase D